MYINELYDLLEPYKKLGELTLKNEGPNVPPLGETSGLQYNEIPPDGTKLIARVLLKRSYADDVKVWLHKLYPPLSSKQINRLESYLKTNIPEAYKSFLSLHNGLKLFSNTFSLEGMRFNYVGDDDYHVMSQPYDILTTNLKEEERPLDANDNFFFIGWYDEDGSHLYIDKESSKVHRCDRDYSKKVFNTWDSFEDMLLSETKRLMALFDEEGKLIDQENPTIDEDKPTTPEPRV